MRRLIAAVRTRRSQLACDAPLSNGKRYPCAAAAGSETACVLL